MHSHNASKVEGVEVTSHDKFDMTIPSYPAPFRSWLVRSGSISYKFKCLSIGPFLYIVGTLTTLATNTFHEFVLDYAFLLGCIISSVALCGIVYGCKQISPTINQLDETVEHSKDTRFKNFIFEMTNEGSWCGVRNRYWYYSHAFGLAVLVAISAYLGFIGPPWVKDVSQRFGWINHFYFFGFWAPVMGYILGLGFELAWMYADSINRYCSGFVKADKIKLYPLEGSGGLKALGKLAVKINIACVTPMVYILVVLFKTWTERGTTLMGNPLYLSMLAIYATVLALVFFYPIMPAHKALVSAKAKAKDCLNRMAKQSFGQGVFVDSPENCILLSSILSSRQSLNKVSTWPLDLRLSIWSMSTILFPLIGGAILQIWFELFFRLFL